MLQCVFFVCVFFFSFLFFFFFFFFCFFFLCVCFFFVLCVDAIAAEMEDMMEELSERMETGELPGLPDTSDLNFSHASRDDDDDGSDEGGDSEDDDDDEDLMEEDPYNSAGEEVCLKLS